VSSTESIAQEEIFGPTDRTIKVSGTSTRQITSLERYSSRSLVLDLHA